MPAGKKKNDWDKLLREWEGQDAQRKSEYHKSLWKKYQKFIDLKLISPKLATGAWFLVRNFDYSEAYLWSSKGTDYRQTVDGEILPNKMIVYREMAKHGYKWNDDEKEWQQENAR